ncbi:MAG: GNAT family N-acetyltransferase [Alistipes sp.]
MLYEADPSREAVADYIARGMLHSPARGRTVGVSVLLRTRPFTMELVNLCVAEPYRGKASPPADRPCRRKARAAKCRILEVGTGNAGIGQLALYQRCGFSIDSIEKDYFVRHYPEPIYENGIECRDMVRLRMEL